MNEHLLIQLAMIGILGSLAQWFAWWVKLPSILFLLLLGFIVGPVTGYLNPDELFGDLLFPMVSLAVSVILFEGALTLKFDEIKGLEKVIQRLVTSGSVVCWILIAIFTHYIMGFDWQLSFLFGALVVVTGPTVIVPMLRTVRVNRRVSNILRWEGIIIDPIGALFAVLVFDFIISSQAGGNEIASTLWVFAKLVFVGSLLGFLAGQILGLILRHHLLPEYLHNVFSLTFVFITFGWSNHLVHESGLLAVTVMGIRLANMKHVPIHDILNFKESLTVLLISGLFIILASRIDLSQIQALGWSALGVFLAIQFFARPIKVLISSWGSNLKWQEKVMVSWIAPRGIVAAAVSALFAIKLTEIGYPQADMLVSLTFIIIISTVVFQSATSRILAKALGVAEPEPLGVLIIGSNPVALAVGKALKNADVQVIVADGSWHNVSKARMMGLKTYFGNPVSRHADQHLDLVGVGHMLGLSMDRHINTLSSQKYKTEFGNNRVYTLSPSIDSKGAEKHITNEEYRGRILFNGATYSALQEGLDNGGSIKSTLMTEEFTFKMFLQKNGTDALPLFAVSPGSKEIRIFYQNSEFSIPKGWQLISLNKKTKETGDAEK